MQNANICEPGGKVGARVSANVPLHIFERPWKEKGIQKWAGIVVKSVKR